MMNTLSLPRKAALYLQKLCVDIPNRAVGSAGNRAATAFFAETISTFQFQTETPPFDCIDWTEDGAILSVNDVFFHPFVSPYSPGCDVRGPLATLSTIEELETAELDGAILLLHGPLTQEPLMPKNFPFYNPEAHQRIVHLLETKRPQAIIAATSRNPEAAGALYPFPFIEDGDFDIPSVYMTEEEGKRLEAYAGHLVSLKINAERTPSTGCNVIARKGGQEKIVLFAHIDAKAGTPGAVDNAGGITILLLLAEIMAAYSDNLGLEIVALNGEDYYANSGEIDYLESNQGRFSEIVLGINLDGVGYFEGNTACSLYGCPADLAALIRKILTAHSGLVEGEAWYQGDHGLFLMNQRPALAFTSECIHTLMSNIIHTAEDIPEIIDTSKLVDTAFALRNLIWALNKREDRSLNRAKKGQLPQRIL